MKLPEILLLIFGFGAIIRHLTAGPLDKKPALFHLLTTAVYFALMLWAGLFR